MPRHTGRIKRHNSFISSSTWRLTSFFQSVTTSFLRNNCFFMTCSSVCCDSIYSLYNITVNMPELGRFWHAAASISPEPAPFWHIMGCPGIALINQSICHFFIDLSIFRVPSVETKWGEYLWPFRVSIHSLTKEHPLPTSPPPPSPPPPYHVTVSGTGPILCEWVHAINYLQGHTIFTSFESEHI